MEFLREASTINKEKRKKQSSNTKNTMGFHQVRIKQNGEDTL